MGKEGVGVHTAFVEPKTIAYIPAGYLVAEKALKLDCRSARIEIL